MVDGMGPDEGVVMAMSGLAVLTVVCVALVLWDAWR